jgi:hypothetical protein
VRPQHAKPGINLHIEMTAEAIRYKVAATVRQLPFFNPARKTKTPV